MSEVLSNFFQSLLGEIVVAAVIAALVSLWGKVEEHWSIPLTVIYGLVAFAALLVVFQYVQWLKPGPRTKIHRWLERGGYSIRTEPASDQQFDFEATDRWGKTVRVRQPRYDGAPVFIEAVLSIGQSERDALGKLSQKEQHEFILNLRLAMLQYGISYMGIDLPLNRVVLQEMFIFDDSMSEREFIWKVFSVHRAITYFQQQCLLKLLVPLG